MSEFNDSMSDPSGSSDQPEASKSIFLNMAETDSTGIPSLKQAPMSAISATEQSKTNTQLVITACVLAIGAGAIYGMRYVGMKAGLDEGMVSIDYAADENSASFARRFGSVMRELDKSTISVHLSNTDEFASNPFSRPQIETDEYVEPIDPGMSEAERLAHQREREEQRNIEQRREDVIGEAMRFRLQGIIGGSRPAARISGKPVRAGMQLGEFFTVIEIGSQIVIIEADGMRFELSMRDETTQISE